MEEEIRITEEQIIQNKKLMKRSKFLIISFFMLFIIDLVFFIVLQKNELFILNINRSSGNNATPIGAEIFSFIFYIIILISVFVFIAFAFAYKDWRRESLETQIQNSSKYEKWFDWADIFSIVPIFLIFIIVLNGFFFSFAKVDGPSMQPSFCNLDTVVIKYTNTYQDGDVVIVNALDEFIIKRLIAGPGDMLVVNNSGVFVNSELKETFVDGNHIYIDRKLNTGEYFVMGDNRENSTDSRFPSVGIISQSQMLGKVVYRMSNKACPIT